MGEIYEVFELVAKFFDGDRKKAMAWMETKNPLLGDLSPRQLFWMGRADKVLKFVKEALVDNGPQA